MSTVDRAQQFWKNRPPRQISFYTTPNSIILQGEDLAILIGCMQNVECHIIERDIKIKIITILAFLLSMIKNHQIVLYSN